MKIYKVNLCLIMGVLIVVCSCVNFNKKISIQPLTFLDTLIKKKINDRIFITKFVSYKVVNFIDNPTSAATINSFIKKNITASELKLYDEFTITFYLPTTETNALSLKQHPDRYYNQDNTIYEYKWSMGKLIAYYKFNDGVIIEPKGKVKVKELTYP